MTAMKNVLWPISLKKMSRNAWRKPSSRPPASTASVASAMAATDAANASRATARPAKTSTPAAATERIASSDRGAAETARHPRHPPRPRRPPRISTRAGWFPRPRGREPSGRDGAGPAGDVEGIERGARNRGADATGRRRDAALRGHGSRPAADGGLHRSHGRGTGGDGHRDDLSEALTLRASDVDAAAPAFGNLRRVFVGATGCARRRPHRRCFIQNARDLSPRRALGPGSIDRCQKSHVFQIDRL